MRDKTILIAGGGVGGLATALAFGKKGYKVRVLEQAPQFGAIGYGIQLGPNVFPFFERLGITDAIMQRSIVPKDVWMFDAMDGKPVTRVHIGPDFHKRYGHPYIVIHRVDLHDVLTSACRDVPSIHLDENAQVTGYSETDAKVTVSLADGRSVEGDLLIGADGLRSKVREQIMGASEPKLTGYVAHRVIVPIEKAPEGVPLDDVVLWGGPGFHIVNYPLRDKGIFNIGNPENDLSIRELAELLVAKFDEHPLRDHFPPFAGFREIESGAYYGAGYQDVQFRKPSIANARKVLGWNPVITAEHAVARTLDWFLRDLVARQGVDTGELRPRSPELTSSAR